MMLFNTRTNTQLCADLVDPFTLFSNQVGVEEELGGSERCTANLAIESLNYEIVPALCIAYTCLHNRTIRELVRDWILVNLFLQTSQ